MIEEREVDVPDVGSVSWGKVTSDPAKEEGLVSYRRSDIESSRGEHTVGNW